MNEVQKSTRTEFDGKLVRVRVDEVAFPDGRHSIREVVEHPGAIGILPVLPDGGLVLVRQFRYAVGRELLEIPAGTREAGEPPEACAHRELAEETGYKASQLEHLLSFFVSPGWCTEELIVYRATGLQAGQADTEEDEVIAVEVIGPDEISGLMRDGWIADAKTVTALLAHLQS